MRRPTRLVFFAGFASSRDPGLGFPFHAIGNAGDSPLSRSSLKRFSGFDIESREAYEGAKVQSNLLPWSAGFV